MFSTNRRMKDRCPLEFEVDLKKKKVGGKGKVQQDKGLEDVVGGEWQFSIGKVVR